MCQTLFVVPESIAGIDVFGFGWLLGLWVVFTVGLLAWSARRQGWNGETWSQLGVSLVLGLAIAFVMPGLVDERLGGLAIRGYGTLLLVAVAAGVGLSLYRAKRVGLDPEVILSLGTWFFVFGIVGARLFYIVEYWPKFQRATLGETLIAMINLTQGGLVVYGSLLAGGAALVIFVYKHRLPGLALADLIAPGVVLGVGLGRLGCFMNGCCYGGLSDVPWAVQFPAETPAYLDQVENHLVYLHGLQLAGTGKDPAVIERVEPGSAAEKSGLRAGQRIKAIDDVPIETVDGATSYLLNAWGADRGLSISVAGDPVMKRYALATAEPVSLPVHPTQLYSFIDAVLLCLFLLAFEPFKRREGELTAIVLTLHPISRFLLEAIRIDESPVFGTGMSISQNISLAILAAGIGLWIYLLRRPAGSAWQGKPALAS